MPMFQLDKAFFFVIFYESQNPSRPLYGSVSFGVFADGLKKLTSFWPASLRFHTSLLINECYTFYWLLLRKGLIKWWDFSSQISEHWFFVIFDGLSWTRKSTISKKALKFNSQSRIAFLSTFLTLLFGRATKRSTPVAEKKAIAKCP